MPFYRNSQQVGAENDRHANASPQVPDEVTCYPINATANNQVVLKYAKCVSPRTFSQKIYQLHTSDVADIAEEFKPTINANSLEEIKKILDDIFLNLVLQSTCNSWR